MKKLALVFALCLAVAFAAGAYAQQEGGYGMGPGYGYGMMGGYGGGPYYHACPGCGWGGGYGMGPWMMGRGYYGRGMGYNWQNPECQKYLDDTAQLRKQLHDRQFEYSEALRNPKTTGDQLARTEGEIRELQNQIYQKAPLGCRW